MKKIKIVETTSLPMCPHCKKEMPSIEKNTKGIFASHIIYMCPHCKTVIGVAFAFSF